METTATVNNMASVVMGSQSVGRNDCQQDDDGKYRQGSQQGQEGRTVNQNMQGCMQVEECHSHANRDKVNESSNVGDVTINAKNNNNDMNRNKQKVEQKYAIKGFKSLNKKYMYSPNNHNQYGGSYAHVSNFNYYNGGANSNSNNNEHIHGQNNAKPSNISNTNQGNKQNVKDNINVNSNNNNRILRQNKPADCSDGNNTSNNTKNHILGSRKVLKNIEQYYQEQLYKLNDKLKSNKQKLYPDKVEDMKENKCRSTIDDQARHKDKQNQERDRSASNREKVVADKSNGKYKNANKIKQTYTPVVQKQENSDASLMKINLKYKQRSHSVLENRDSRKSSQKDTQFIYGKDNAQQHEQKDKQLQTESRQKQNKRQLEKLSMQTNQCTNTAERSSKGQKSKNTKNFSYRYNKNGNNWNCVKNEQQNKNPNSIHKRNRSNISNPSPNKMKLGVLSNQNQNKQQPKRDTSSRNQNYTRQHHLSNPKDNQQLDVKDRLNNGNKNMVRKQNYYENSPSNLPGHGHQNSSVYNIKFGSNKVINSNTKNTQQFVTNNNNINNNVSSFRSPSKQTYTIPSNNNIICQSVSKDGNYKIVSRSLNVEQLKQAVELEHNINMKAKKQSIKQLQQNKNIKSSSNLNPQNVSPRHNKYVLDPSKISNKQNGNVKAYSVNSNQGISRKYNEDRVSIILNITKNNVKASYFAIYDGHGGSNCCDFLTQNLHQFIFNSKYFPNQPRQALIQGMKLAQTKFIEMVKNNYKQKKQLDRSGSCAIILLIVGDQCYIANLGDSRAILSTCNGKPMYSLSRDHKPTDSGQQMRILKQGGKIYRTEMFKLRKQITAFENKKQDHNKSVSQETEIIVGPLRVFPGKLSVTRTFGDIQAKQPQFGGINNCISIEPQICKYSLTGKQDFVVLGCDGVFQRLDSEEVIEQVWKCLKKNKNSSLHESIGNAAQSVVKLCMDRKSTDNITVILVCLSLLGLGNNISDYASV